MNVNSIDVNYFLDMHGFNNALILQMFGDASFRRYKRVVKDGSSYILAIYPSSEKGGFKSFIQLSAYLLKNGFSAPKVIAHDYSCGLMLLEDFGNSVFTHIISDDNQLELYSATIDVLVLLQKLFPYEGLSRQSNNLMVDELEVFLQYYCLYRKVSLKECEKKDFFDIMHAVLSATNLSYDTLCLRDFHSPNLIHLPTRHGSKKIGIIDFQDAMISTKVYDVVSLINDARIMVNDSLANILLMRYIESMKIDNQMEFHDHFDIVATQRNLRILGVFARQKLEYNNAKYEAYLPIVLYYLKKNLMNYNLIELNKWLKGLNIF